jgi:hypothetical protein
MCFQLIADQYGISGLKSASLCFCIQLILRECTQHEGFGTLEQDAGGSAEALLYGSHPALVL